MASCVAVGVDEAWEVALEVAVSLPCKISNRLKVGVTCSGARVGEDVGVMGVGQGVWVGGMGVDV